MSSDSDCDVDEDITDVSSSEDVARAWDNEEIEDEAQSTSAVLAEKMRLSLPSNLKKGNIESHIFSHLCEQEAKLCEGQINESAARLSSPSA
jgi:hypothetical protein